MMTRRFRSASCGSNSFCVYLGGVVPGCSVQIEAGNDKRVGVVRIVKCTIIQATLAVALRKRVMHSRWPTPDAPSTDVLLYLST